MVKSKETKHQIIFWAALSILFVLRFPLLSWVINFNPSAALWIEPIYQIGTYTIIVFLIWWEWDYLCIHHIDVITILIIIFFKPLSTILLLFINPENPITFPKVLSLPFVIFAFILTVILIKKKGNFEKNSRKSFFWFLVGGIIGIAFMAFQGIIMINFLNFPFPLNPGPISVIYPLYQLGYAAVPEEPVFRGFLWGGLRKAGVGDIWILLIQAVLFTAGHIFLINEKSGFLYLVLIFVDAILLGCLVWCSKTLSSSIGFHGFANGSQLIQYWIYMLLLK